MNHGQRSLAGVHTIVSALSGVLQEPSEFHKPNDHHSNSKASQQAIGYKGFLFRCFVYQPERAVCCTQPRSSPLALPPSIFISAAVVRKLTCLSSQSMHREAPKTTPAAKRDQRTQN
jgi:hypothetical protein